MRYSKGCGTRRFVPGIVAALLLPLGVFAVASAAGGDDPSIANPNHLEGRREFVEQSRHLALVNCSGEPKISSGPGLSLPAAVVERDLEGLTANERAELGLDLSEIGALAAMDQSFPISDELGWAGLSHAGYLDSATFRDQLFTDAGLKTKDLIDLAGVKNGDLSVWTNTGNTGDARIAIVLKDGELGWTTQTAEICQLEASGRVSSAEDLKAEEE